MILAKLLSLKNYLGHPREDIKPAIQFLIEHGIDPSDKGNSGTSGIEATQLSKKLKDNVKVKAVEFMKRVSAKFETEWMQNRLPPAMHQVFSIVQQSDPSPALRQYLRGWYILQGLISKLVLL